MYNWLNDFNIRLLEKHYCKDGETINDAFTKACQCFSNGDWALQERLEQYISQGWFMFSSPTLSNAVWEGEKVKGLPISCFLTYVPDSIEGLCDHTTETRWLSVKGGGVGGHWSDVRSMDNITPGPMSFIHTHDGDMTAYKQGATRRGSYATYLDISHPDIEEYIKMRTPTGDLNRKSLNLHHGINITDSFIQAVDNDEMFSLVDPHTLHVKKVVRARELWEEILITRFRTGEPYINYIDEANHYLNPALKARGMSIRGSNLCNEIHLPTDDAHTAVCCLSSVNLAMYDEWKDTDMVKDLIVMLDNVIEFFIQHAPPELEKAVRSAKGSRDLGLGAMGFHDYLQKHMIPFESGLAISLNRGMFDTIKKQATEASQQLAIQRGEPEYLKGTGMRNGHLLAVAPNANSSIILDTSPSIELRMSNAYLQKTRVGTKMIKNPYLDEIITKRCGGIEDMYNEVWQDIINNDGSIQGFNFFDIEEQTVFKTAMETDQRFVIDHARARQEFICQGQSVNVFFPSGSDKEYVNQVHRRAFALEGIGVPLKGLYYLRTESGKKTEKVALQVQREALQDGVAGATECISCEG